MHELSIAQAIAGVAARHAGAARVERVHVRIGHLRQVVPSALAFSFELCAHGTPVDGAELEIEAVPIGAVCRDCATESRLESFPLQCRRCGGFELEILEGEELMVEYLELEEA